jgi:hypothetical protein
MNTSSCQNGTREEQKKKKFSFASGKSKLNGLTPIHHVYDNTHTLFITSLCEGLSLLHTLHLTRSCGKSVLLQYAVSQSAEWKLSHTSHRLTRSDIALGRFQLLKLLLHANQQLRDTPPITGAIMECAKMWIMTGNNRAADALFSLSR